MVKLKTNNEEKIDAYFATKNELDAIRSDETLLKWEILSKAYKLGKEIWGRDFTIVRLSKDMALPYTTTKRCLALDNATPRSWELLRKKKISAYKLAMVCLLKNNDYQDEIVDIVIKDNISTSKIKGLKARNMQDVNKWRHTRAVEKGYSRQDSAYRNFKNWIDRGKVFMLMPLASVGVKNKGEMLEELKLLQLKIGRYIKKHGEDNVK